MALHVVLVALVAQSEHGTQIGVKILVQSPG
jgi:hypothetical protein